MPALAGAGIQKDRRAAMHAVPHIGAPVRAPAIMAAIDSQARRDRSTQRMLRSG